MTNTVLLNTYTTFVVAKSVLSNYKRHLKPLEAVTGRFTYPDRTINSLKFIYINGFGEYSQGGDFCNFRPSMVKKIKQIKLVIA